MAEDKTQNGSEVKEVKKGKKIKEKKVRPVHPLVGVTGSYPFQTVPPDYQFGTHAKLSKKDFVTKSGYLDYRVAQLERHLDKLKTYRDDWKATGGTAGRAAKRLLKMQQKMAAMRQQLIAAGIDPDALLAGMTPAAS